MAQRSAKNSGIIVKVALISAICVCIGTIVKLEVNFNTLKSRTETLEQNIEDYGNDIELLQDELKGEVDDEYVMKIAREKLGYCMPDEIIFYNNGVD